MIERNILCKFFKLQISPSNIVVFLSEIVFSFQNLLKKNIFYIKPNKYQQAQKFPLYVLKISNFELCKK
jgi:hypothetical protein